MARKEVNVPKQQSSNIRTSNENVSVPEEFKNLFDLKESTFNCKQKEKLMLKTRYTSWLYRINQVPYRPQRRSKTIQEPALQEQPPCTDRNIKTRYAREGHYRTFD